MSRHVWFAPYVVIGSRITDPHLTNATPYWDRPAPTCPPQSGRMCRARPLAAVVTAHPVGLYSYVAPVFAHALVLLSSGGRFRLLEQCQALHSEPVA